MKIHAILVVCVSMLFAANSACALESPEVVTIDQAIEQCVGTKKFTITKKTDIQKEGLEAWKANGNTEPYPLPPTLEFIVDYVRAKKIRKHTCKIQQQPSKKWKLIEGLSWEVDP